MHTPAICALRPDDMFERLDKFSREPPVGNQNHPNHRSLCWSDRYDLGRNCGATRRDKGRRDGHNKITGPQSCPKPEGLKLRRQALGHIPPSDAME